MRHKLLNMMEMAQERVFLDENVELDETFVKASINLNRINSFHSKIKGYYRTYRGVASKFINRYAAFFSLAWKLKKQGVEDLTKKVRSMILDFRLFLSLSDLKKYRLIMPDDIEWRPAS